MDRPPTILIVDDEPPVRRLLRRCFESEAYAVLEAANGSEALAALESEEVDLMTLDLNLGGEDGLNVARRVRAISEVAIVMVSGKGDLIDKVVGLEVGADDYIAKPFELREVLARVRSVLRRTRAVRTSRTGAPSADGTEAVSGGGTGDTTPERARSAPRGAGATRGGDEPYAVPDHRNAEMLLHFAGCTFDPLARELRGTDREEVALTTAEFELLHLFLRHGRRALTRDAIMDALKGTDWHPNDRTIDNHVARLRRKLEQGGAPNAIKTIRGIGYQLVASVSSTPGTA